MSLDEQQSLSGTTLRFRQKPGAPWLFLLFLLCFVSGVVGAIYVLPPLFFLMVVAALASLTVTVELTATRLRLKGWTGGIPLPREHDLPLHGLQVETRSRWRINGVPHHSLVLKQRDGTEIVVPVLAVDREALDTIRARIEAGRAEAADRHGAGTAEVPADLRRALRERQHE